MSRRTLIALGVVAVPVIAVAWWLGSPLFLDKSVDEQFPLTVTAQVPDTMTRAQAEAVMSTAAVADHPMTEEMPAAPQEPHAVARGTFRDADSFHRGSGRATIYRLPDGSHLLRLEDFRVTNGPDLRVLLAAHADPMARDDLNAGGYVELAKLKGNIGNQNYEIPADVDVGAHHSVVIYCRPFHVVFSVAALEAVAGR